MAIPWAHRDPTKHAIGWEIYDFQHFFLTIGIGSFEIQINKWRPSTKFRKDGK